MASPSTDWDQQIAELVQDGSLDIALAPTWAWDVAGVTSLQPLQSPFLVDSDALVGRVLTDDRLAGQLMSGLPDVGVTGLALWPEGLRHPFGFDGPLAELADYRDVTVRSALSSVTRDVFAALGAKVSAEDPDATTMAGVQGEFLLKPNGVGAANLTFFPKVNVLYANTDAFEGLPAQDQATIRAAATATRGWARENVPGDVQAGKAFCQGGGVVTQATQAQVAALERTTSPVAKAIAQQAGNAGVVRRITQLKAALPAPERAAACGQTPGATAGAPGEAESALNGTYRYTITKQALVDGGSTPDLADKNAGVWTFELEDGTVHETLQSTEVPQHAEDTAGYDGTYSVDGNAITFRFPVFENEVDHLTFEQGPTGDLTMMWVDGPPLDEVGFASQVWKKIA